MPAGIGKVAVSFREVFTLSADVSFVTCVVTVVLEPSLTCMRVLEAAAFAFPIFFMV